MRHKLLTLTNATTRFVLSCEIERRGFRIRSELETGNDQTAYQQSEPCDCANQGARCNPMESSEQGGTPKNQGKNQELLAGRLKDRRLVFLSQNVELNFGHPCGSCVMSNDPSTGMVDRDCRAHGIANLFITDASFMPTSAATKPSLTIAANALRVAGKINRILTGDPNWNAPERAESVKTYARSS